MGARNGVFRLGPLGARCSPIIGTARGARARTERARKAIVFFDQSVALDTARRLANLLALLRSLGDKEATLLSFDNRSACHLMVSSPAAPPYWPRTVPLPPPPALLGLRCVLVLSIRSSI